jgi:hypothetical protein
MTGRRQHVNVVKVSSKEFCKDPAGTFQRATERPEGLTITDARGRVVGVLSVPTDRQPHGDE